MDAITLGDLETWREVETAIGEKAEELCRAACDGGQGCRACGARHDGAWRRDALRALRAEATSRPDFRRAIPFTPPDDPPPARPSRAQLDMIAIAIRHDDNPWRHIGARSRGGGALHRMMERMKAWGWFDGDTHITEKGRAVYDAAIARKRK